jgi:hypothetical protein
MSRARLFFCVVPAMLLAPHAMAAQVSRDTVALTPSVVTAGSPELSRVRAPGAQAVEGKWLGRDV